MGSAASKASRIASQSTATRKYPVRDPSSLTKSVGPETHPPPHISEVHKDTATILDASDPDFQSMLHRIGIVDTSRSIPDQTFPPPSSFLKGTNPHQQPREANPALHILSARSEIQKKVEHQMEDTELRDKREWVDTDTIRRILHLRDEQGWGEEEIEKALGLKDGVVRRLGGRVSLV